MQAIAGEFNLSETTFILPPKNPAHRAEVVDLTGGVVLPGLVERLSEVTAVVIRSADGTATIRRVDAGWGLGERSDYPVDPDKVRPEHQDLIDAIIEQGNSELRG